MPCTILISSVTGSQNGPNTYVVIQGTVSGCTSGQIVVQVTCGAQTYSQNVPIAIGQTNWNTAVLTQCMCNGPVVVMASCPLQGCSTSFNVPSLSCCCPQLSLTTTESTICIQPTQACPSGGRQITFNVSGTLPPGCSSASIQINYGDTTVSQVYNVSSSPFFINDYHVYCLNIPHNGIVSVTAPTFCQGITFVANPSPCPPCNTNFGIKLLCGFIEGLILLFGTLALTMFFIPNVACGPTLGFAIIYLFLALALLIIYTSNNILHCIDCACFPYLKWLGIIILASGICLILFVITSCNPLPVFIPFIVMAGGFLTIWIWYTIYIFLCPLTICHFWAAVRLAGIIATIAIGIIYFTIPLITVLNLFVALVTALGITLLGQQMISNNQNAVPSNCVNYP